MGSYHKLTPEKIEEIKWLWITNYPNPDYSFKELAKKFKVSENRIKQLSCEGKWQAERSKFLAQKSKNIRNRMIEMFTDAGLPPEKLIKLIAEDALGTPCYKDIKDTAYSVTKTKDTKGRIKSEKKIPKTITVTIDNAVDNNTTSFYRKLAADLMDLQPNPRKAVEDEQGEESKIPVKSHL